MQLKRLADHHIGDLIDHVKFPKGFKLPNFTLFSGEENQSVVEHIGRFTIQCREVSTNDFLKLGLFCNSLTGSAFNWYINLQSYSIHSWQTRSRRFTNNSIILSRRYTWQTYHGCVRRKIICTKLHKSFKKDEDQKSLGHNRERIHQVGPGKIKLQAPKTFRMDKVTWLVRATWYEGILK